MLSISEFYNQYKNSPNRIEFMLSGAMTSPSKIEEEAWKFFRKVIKGINDRPAHFSTDDEMAKAAGVDTTTFNEYKSGRKGHKRPGLITIYKLAYVLKGFPPCFIDKNADLLAFKINAAKNKDIYGLIDKLISIIDADVDIDHIAAAINVSYKKLFPPQEESKSS